MGPGRVKTQSVLWFPLLNRGGMMKGFVQGADRQQTTLLPECLDDWVGESNPVRAVDVFVDALELRDLGFDGVDPAATGRPAYHPSPMLKLYIYGYLNRVQSSRRLEREAGRNLEVMWLTGRLVPDHKTIADFRKDNGPAIKKVCARFVELCRKMGLLAKASVAVDGSKFKAVNSRDNNFTQGKIKRRQKQIEESVARYMSQLDTADRRTAAGEDPSEAVLLTKTRLKEKLAKLEEEVKRLAAIEKALLASPDKQISLTDPDCRSMAMSGRGTRGWRGIYKMSISRKLQRARARAMEKPQVKRAMADARKDFIAKFGREPLEGEPLIFDPDFDTPTPYTDEKMTAMMIEAMEAAGTPGHLIYAYRKTGMIMGAENAGLWTEEEIDEWNAAMAEYEALHGPIGEEK